MRRRDFLKTAAVVPLLHPVGAAAFAQDDVAGIDTSLQGDGTGIIMPVEGDGTGVTTTVGLAGPTKGAILPQNRVLSYYGFPGNELMGILGAHDPADLLDLIRTQADAYAAIDDSRPIKPAFEVIASVAQRDPMDDGSYLTYTSGDIIEDYVKFTRDHHLLLLLDMQFGRRTVKEEIDAVIEWLHEPHVHIALDPEFHVQAGEVPGEDLGSIDASDVTYAQKRLARFCADQGIPPKLLIVHQFNLYSISNRDKIKPVDGVQMVLEVDGWGPPDEKRDTYKVVADVKTIDYYGFKLWYDQDQPLMSERDVLALNPSPDVIIYQ